MSQRTIKWGILGCGGISSTFAKDLRLAEGAELTAVAARSLEKAEQFAEQHGFARAYGSYEELFNDSEVEIVYVGTIHPLHKEQVLACLHAGKAVLCEKPFTINEAEAREIAQLARDKKLFVMEAMWTRFLPPIVRTREWLKQGLIGDVQLVKADFGFDAGWNPEGRLLSKEQGGGALLDAGVYPVSFASMVYGEQPKSIQSSAHIGETGVDERFSLLFEYDGGRTAMLNGAVRLSLTNDAHIFGTKGYIHIPNFLFSNKASLHVQGQDPVTVEDNRQFAGYKYEAEAAMACLRSGMLENEDITLDETVGIMETMDRIRKQWGLVYPSEQGE
ncbi:gfo/Idh/MocA family oxidoreductase [Paenibacillus nanensis]|uniref:Gfo/Idh/MocA family oxidoreductase n=1 Tax=Paenibacillus nanensis TaxID=393251 RepID=A0A3A1UM27_9BACL|nr:Gfo/Idh/MocA family oxidoreductase [Paenibacillus nanensis]RIX48732.1 gfo/Idh/MocA family oxidoreductase [Paenibacillus nanensis]